MAHTNQIGLTRKYTTTTETTDNTTKTCPVCQVVAVPRGISSTKVTATEDKVHCPNCGHIYGREKDLLTLHPVETIAVTGAAGATTITTDNGTLRMSASIKPYYATNKNIVWSVEAGTGTATISDTGLLTAATNGTVTVKATAQDGSSVVGKLVVTLSNQS